MIDAEAVAVSGAPNEWLESGTNDRNGDRPVLSEKAHTSGTEVSAKTETLLAQGRAGSLTGSRLARLG